MDFQKGGKFFSLSETWGTYSGLLEETAGLNNNGINVREDVDLANPTQSGGVNVVGVDASGAAVDTYVSANPYFAQFKANNIAEPFVHDASYLKLRDVSLSYTFSGAKFRNIFQSATVGVVARNLWLIAVSKDNKNGWDPSELAGGFGENAQLPGTRSLGFNVNSDPRNIRIYGNGGRMLPLLNSIPYLDDLEENAIQIIGEADGVFDNTDYILFYAEGVDTWNSESLTSGNLFADKSYYYITSRAGGGKRIQTAAEPSGAPSLVFSKFDDVIYYEKDRVNVGKVGRRWFGEQFNIDNAQSFNFTIPNIDTSIPVAYRINTASKSFGVTSFGIKINNQNVGAITYSIPLIAFSGTEAYESALSGVFTASSPAISVIAYQPQTCTFCKSVIATKSCSPQYLRIVIICCVLMS
jgi:hypothetical protein